MNIKKIQYYLQKKHLPDIRIYWFHQIDSTNSWLKDNGLPNNLCLAEKQLLGKGSRGKIWYSPSQNNIYFSMKIEMKLTPTYLPLLALWVAINLCEILKQQGVSGHGIKWPNDIHWKGKKLAGILLESCDNMSAMVVGIGLNVGMFDADLSIDKPWCSLSQIIGKEVIVDREFLVAELAMSVIKSWQQLVDESLDFQSKWQQWSLLDGKLVELVDLTINKKQTVKTSIKGRVQGVDDYGRLRLQNTITGITQAYSVGEVTILEYFN